MLDINIVKVSEEEEQDMVLIPEGLFLMGNEAGYAEEKPLHLVKVASFYMDKNLVINSVYKSFCDANCIEYPTDPRWPEMPNYFTSYPDYPVVNISSEQAANYAAWVGKRLPTEQEWEFAACGGQSQPIYPWGNKTPDGSLANFADRNTNFAWRDFRYSSGYKYTSPVGCFEPNSYGLYDMAGNVWEWTNDWYFDYTDNVKDLEALKDGWGASKICRGGCYHSSIFDLRVSRRRRILGGAAQISVGFRCVRDISSKVNCYNQLQSCFKEKENIQLSFSDLKLQDDSELCMGIGIGIITLERALQIKKLGFTSVEHYIPWAAIENKGKDNWDFSLCDNQVEILEKAGLKWVPFLIAGPAYSLPDWYRESKEFSGLCCLEHNIESKIQSIWDKSFYEYVERFIAKFAEKYSDKEIIEAPLLGISGDFGESIFPVWHGNWTTQIAGLYHTHAGYWCNDVYAQNDFIESFKLKYSDIEALNSKWGTSFKSFEEISFPKLAIDPIEGFRVDEFTLDGKFYAISKEEKIRWLDFVDWYCTSMSQYSDFWIRTTRKYFPDKPVYLCTGGDALSCHGANFAQQSKIAARYKGGIRITNEASDYATNFTITNWVSSAGNFYDSYFSFEPASMVNEKGIAARIYNAAATKAKGLHFYENNILETQSKIDTYVENFPNLKRKEIRKSIGVLYPETSLYLSTLKSIEFLKGFELFRDYSDYIFLDDLTINDGILNTVEIAVICCGDQYRRNTLEKLVNWVSKGGILIAYNVEKLISVDEDADYFSVLFNIEGGKRKIGEGTTLFIKAVVNIDKSQKDIIIGSQPLTATFLDSTEYYQENIFNKITDFLMSTGYFIADGIIDGIYAANTEDGIILLNTNDMEIKRNFACKNGLLKEVLIKGSSIVYI